MHAAFPIEEVAESQRFVVGVAVFVTTALIVFPALIFAAVVPAEPTYIRICNATDRELHAVELHSQSYGDLAVGEISEYKYVFPSFDGESVNAIAGNLGRSSGQPLFCRVGSTPLPPGRYTFSVQLVPLEGGGFYLLAQREGAESACPNHSIEETNNGGSVLGSLPKLVPPSFSPHVKPSAS